jgi:hypothetical protein
MKRLANGEYNRWLSLKAGEMRNGVRKVRRRK